MRNACSVDGVHAGVHDIHVYNVRCAECTYLDFDLRDN